MVEGEAADGHIKFTIRERQPLGIAPLKTDIRQAALLPLPFSDGQQRISEIEPDRFTAMLSKGQRQVPGTASDLEHARFWRGSNGFDQPCDAGRVCQRRTHRIHFGLLRKRFLHYGLVCGVRHSVPQCRRCGEKPALTLLLAARCSWARVSVPDSL